MAIDHVGPNPGLIKVAKGYIFEQQIRRNLKALGVAEAKEDNNRLLGVAWIDDVRQALQLPIRTYNTAVVYYHRFRLVHPANEYDFRDASAAALFAACKIEDTLKKSRDILCAAQNLTRPSNDPLSPDDPMFENLSKTIVGLERLMLEASGFNFRNRYPQRLVCKIAKAAKIDRYTVALTSYDMTRDLYRTFAPLKQTVSTMALACFELAIRLCQIDLAEIKTETGFDYEIWHTTRGEIMETLLDMLDLYINHRSMTIVGQRHVLDEFIAIRITLNQEASAQGYPRYTNWIDGPSPKTPAEGEDVNGKISNSTLMSDYAHTVLVGQNVRPAGEQGRDTTVRFVFDPSQAREEKKVVDQYFREDEYEYV
ncbi:MAG: RNA polymerase II C-terminal domain kinase beta subunit [Chrysothrix sp. TS-e1954]|nr:MAG: RNA polymerase II C-terminal domain kinase beta subunit [Chrysothrix sp. TS-e1954]